MSQGSLLACGKEHPVRQAWEPCPLDADHDEGCVFWRQAKPNATRGRNGVWVVDEMGHAVAHGTFEGAVGPVEVRALLSLRSAVAKMRAG